MPDYLIVANTIGAIILLALIIAEAYDTKKERDEKKRSINQTIYK